MLMILAIFLIALILRSAVFIGNKWVGIDTFFHLVYALAFKKKNKIRIEIDAIVEDSSTKEMKVYPPLFQMLLAMFSKESHSKLRFLPTIFDLLNLLLLFWLASTLFGTTVAYIASFIYAISPILVLSCLSTNPRTLANTLFTISMLSVYGYLSTSNLIFIPLFILSSSAVFLMHRLTIQSMFFVVLVVLIMFLNPMPMVLLITSFLFTVLITKGQSLVFMRSQLKNLKRHFRVGHYKHGTKKPENPATMFASLPFMLIILVYIILNGFSSENLFMQYWFFSMMAVSFLWIWGDGYRYLTNAVFPAAILAALYISSIPYSFWFFIFCTACSFGVSCAMVYKFVTTRRVVNSPALNCFEYVRKHSSPNDAMIVSPYYYAFAGGYFSGVKTFSMSGDDILKAIKKGFALGHRVRWIITTDMKIMKGAKGYKEVYKDGDFKIFKKK